MKLSYLLNAAAASRITLPLSISALVFAAIAGMSLARWIDAEYAFRHAQHAKAAAEREVKSLREETELLALLNSHAALLDSLTQRRHAPLSRAEEARYLQVSAKSSGVRFNRLEQRDSSETEAEVTTIEVNGGYADTKKWLQRLSLAPVIWVVKEIRIIREDDASPNITTRIKLLSYAR